MKKAIAAVLVTVLLTAGLLVGCVGALVTGSGNLKSEEMDFGDFTLVEVGSAFEVEVVKSDSYSVSITADDNLFKHIEVSKEGKTLKIGLKPRIIFGSVTLKAKITMPQLRGLALSGATPGTVSSFGSTENVDLEVSGAISLDLVDISAGVGLGTNVNNSQKYLSVGL